MPRRLVATPACLAAAPPLQRPEALVEHRCLQYGNERDGAHWQIEGPDGSALGSD